jgi:hypothetical protein
LCSETASKSDRQAFMKLCLGTASRLAADRSTNFLPVIIAQAFFIGSVVIAIVRTIGLAEGTNPQTYIDIETYSIGFTALYFWVISTVTLTSVIGTSQTANAIPDTLADFRRNLVNRGFQQGESDLPKDLDTEERYRRGGIYSWQCDGAPKDVFDNTTVHLQRRISPIDSRARRRSSTQVVLQQSWPWLCTFLPLLNISVGTIIGMVLTSLVPPDGWSCRSIAELAIFGVWIFSYPLTLIPMRGHHRRRFWFTFAKDFIAMAATLGVVIATQIGIFNKCSCYANSDTGLALPQMPVVQTILQNRLKQEYPVLTVMGIVAQLVVFPGIVLWRYYSSVRVFLQRDDGRSNLQWLYNIFDWAWWMAQKQSFKDWMKKKRNVHPTEPGRGLERGVHTDEADAALIDDGQDEIDVHKGAIVHVERAPQEDQFTGFLQLPENVLTHGQL